MGFFSSSHGYIQLNGPSGGYIDFSTSGTDHKGRLLYDNTGNYMRFDTNGSEKMRINSGGAVLINASAPRESASKLSVQGGMSEFETTLTNGSDWANSPVSILERANIGTGSSDNKYSPNLNFHWSGRVSNSLWMSDNGHLNWGSYTSGGVPAADGVFRTQEIYLIGTGRITGVDTVSASTDAANKAYVDAHGGGIGPFLPLAGGTMDSGAAITFVVPSSGGNFININHTGNENWSFGAQSGSGVDDYIDIGINGGTRVMSWHEDGNVGIGTTSPANKLVVSVSTAGDYAALINNTNSTNGYGLLARTASTGTSSYAFAARAGSSDIFVVRADGNVGVGTASPGAKLDVNGATYVRSVIFGYAGGGNQYGGLSWGGTDEGFLFLKDSNVTKVNINSNGNSYLNGGNVGIGTTSPNSKLDIRRSGNGVALELHQTSGSANDFVDLKMIAGNTGAGTLGTILRHKRDGSGGGDFSILTNPTLTGTPTEKLIVKSSGNVGIGTASPIVKLHVSGANASVGTIGTPKNDWYTAAYNGIQVGDGTTLWGRAADSHFSGNYYVKDNSGAAQDTYINTLSAHDLWLDNSSGSLKYRNAGLGSAGSAISWNTRFVVLTNGNFGIGTTNPSQKLEVAGYLKANGLFYNGTSGGELRIDNSSGGGIGYYADNTGHTFNTWVGAWQPRMSITDAGLVGIGTTSPTVRLHVVSSTPDAAIFDTTSAVYGAMNTFKAQGVTKGASGYNSGSMYFGGEAGTNTIIQSGGQTGIYINNSTRNVGIGTTSPEEKLKVIGSVLISNNEFYKVENTTGTNYKIAGLTNGNMIQIGAIDYTSAGTIFAGGDNVSITTGGASGSTRIKIASSGNVGIGTTSPGSKLQVAGEIRAADGNKGTPSYSFTSDTNTGMYSDAADTIKFTVGGNDTLIINSSNNVGIGTNAPDVKFHVTKNEDGSGLDKGTAKFINTNTGQGATTMHMVQTSSSNFANAVKFWQGSTPTAVGFIRLTTSATQFITSASDLNLKKNITNWSDDTLSKFKVLEPKKFRFKTQDVSEDKTLGFIAQNEVDNFPEAYPQFLGDDEKPYYGFNPTGMVPHLMKAIKDLVEKVEILENKITQLENNN